MAVLSNASGPVAPTQVVYVLRMFAVSCDGRLGFILLAGPARILDLLSGSPEAPRMVDPGVPPASQRDLYRVSRALPFLEQDPRTYVYRMTAWIQAAPGAPGGVRVERYPGSQSSDTKVVAAAEQLLGRFSSYVVSTVGNISKQGDICAIL